MVMGGGWLREWSLIGGLAEPSYTTPHGMRGVWELFLRVVDPRARSNVAGNNRDRVATRLREQHRLPAVEFLRDRGDFVIQRRALARDREAPCIGQVPEPGPQVAGVKRGGAGHGTNLAAPAGFG